MEYAGKRLLIIGGAFQHVKLVEAAHNMGVITYVVDYLPLEKAPAKQIADYHYELNIYDIDDIVAMCKAEKIDGVLSSHLDACQLPYQQVCEKLGLPCFGTKEQFHVLTDKTAFLSYCKENGVSIIPQYTEAELLSNPETVEYPIFVKPCDSRGSRGQSICRKPSEVKAAIAFAQSESKTGKIVAEKYMGGKPEFTMSYLFIDGEAYCVRTGDRYVGPASDKMDKSAIMAISPSKYDKLYFDGEGNRVVKMLQNLGIKNGPVFMQGFVDENVVRMFDPGLRFPGFEYDRMYEKATGISIPKALVAFALSGEFPVEYKRIDPKANLNGYYVSALFVVLKPGKIHKIEGLDKIKKKKEIVSVSQRYNEGDVVGEYYNVNQRFAEINMLCNSIEQTSETVEWIYDTLKIYDEEGNDMKIAKFDTNRICERYSK